MSRRGKSIRLCLRRGWYSSRGSGGCILGRGIVSWELLLLMSSPEIYRRGPALRLMLLVCLAEVVLYRPVCQIAGRLKFG